jgi:hypothetical protein
MLKEGVISMLKVFVSMIVLSLLVGCTKYETPGQRYLRELSEGYAKEAIELKKNMLHEQKRISLVSMGFTLIVLSMMINMYEELVGFHLR